MDAKSFDPWLVCDRETIRDAAEKTWILCKRNDELQHGTDQTQIYTEEKGLI